MFILKTFHCLHYLHTNFIFIWFTETLRKYPVLPYLSRRALEDYTFEGTKVSIPKGTLICIPVFPIHHDSSIYPNPEKFDPERFSEDEVKKRHPMHYFPFGHGPRNCIGMYRFLSRHIIHCKILQIFTLFYIIKIVFLTIEKKFKF